MGSHHSRAVSNTIGSLVRPHGRRYHSASNAPAFGAPVRVTGSAPPSRRSLPGRMLINLLPDFFAVLNSTDRVAAYQRYFQAHRRILEPYWQNYVVDPDGPHFADVARSTALADHLDLREMLERTDVVALARATEERCAKLLEQDVDVDIVLMVGVGAANAGELVDRWTGCRLRLPRALHLGRQSRYSGTGAGSRAPAAVAGA